MKTVSLTLEKNKKILSALCSVIESIEIKGFNMTDAERNTYHYLVEQAEYIGELIRKELK